MNLWDANLGLLKEQEVNRCPEPILECLVWISTTLHSDSASYYCAWAEADIWRMSQRMKFVFLSVFLCSLCHTVFHINKILSYMIVFESPGSMEKKSILGVLYFYCFFLIIPCLLIFQKLKLKNAFNWNTSLGVVKKDVCHLCYLK